MKSALDCIPCFVAQALNVARLTTDNPQIHERILREALRRASEADLAQSPALFGRGIHRLVRELTGQEDPYLAIKQESNRLALALLPALSRTVPLTLLLTPSAVIVTGAGHLSIPDPVSEQTKLTVTFCFVQLLAR